MFFFPASCSSAQPQKITFNRICDFCLVNYASEEFLSHKCTYRCEKCDATFKCRLGFIEHLATRHGKRKVVLCDLCAEFCNRPTSETPGENCDSCKKIVALNTKLFIPLRNRKEQHSFKCESCHQLFYRTCALDNNIRSYEEFELAEMEEEEEVKKKKQKDNNKLFKTDLRVAKDLKAKKDKVETVQHVDEEEGQKQKLLRIKKKDDNEEEKVLNLVHRSVETSDEVQTRKRCCFVDYYRQNDIMSLTAGLVTIGFIFLGLVIMFFIWSGFEISWYLF